MDCETTQYRWYLYFGTLKFSRAGDISVALVSMTICEIWAMLSFGEFGWSKAGITCHSLCWSIECQPLALLFAYVPHGASILFFVNFCAFIYVTLNISYMSWTESPLLCHIGQIVHVTDRIY